VQSGLDNVEKILNDYIDLLFQDKNINIRAEIDVMLNWYGANKENIDEYPKNN
jgi:hypothetical protein